MNEINELEEERLKGIPVDEQETVVQFDRKGEYMTIYTTDTTMMTKLDKCVESGNYEVIERHRLQGSSRVIGKTYKSRKKLLSFRTSNRANKRVMTEEEKRAFVERTQNAKKAKSQNQF